ncbi:protein EFFECTOR OF TRANSCRIPTION 2-like isoform X2 [Euphorbia lathyris]|uniref:protein EFFECTOR OF TRANSCRIPTION 2-like isoform X2 n=1 Tax=Euphorbia lathyris TaxID=212925 RepID=UPI00331400C9
MAAGKNSVSPLSAARFKREDYKRTKHDSHFSKWQVLIGPSDWEDYAQGKEGAARYRVHSLPSRSAPGLYELGVAVSRSGFGRNVGKLDPDDIAVVYLGQAENVRSRLQRYGRCGAHLGNATGDWSDSKTASPQNGIGLFEEIFSKGYRIVYRWALMRDKRSAEKTEAQLLDTFDYAWNKGSNGDRRPKDIIQKLGEIASRSSFKFTTISKKLLFLRPGQVGIKIEAGKPPLPEECTVDGKSFLHGIFKFSRWQPRLLVPEKSGIEENSSTICGILTSEGIPCKQAPVPGRKRCKQHKGMRIYGLKAKPIAPENSHSLPDVHLDSSSSVCGVNLGDGNFCKKEAVSGRKRCKEHKGMRIKSSVFKPISEEKQKQCRKRCEEHKGMRVSTKYKHHVVIDGLN